MYPGDPNGRPEEIYNCRCTVSANIDDDGERKGQRRAIDPVTGKSVLIENMTYSEWVEWKKAEKPEAWEAYIKKTRNESSDRKQFEEYKTVLGRNAPKSFEEFQNLKYNNSDKWSQLKTAKRQTAFVNNAPCVTTTKKYTGYFLKPGAKHADEFFNVGYTSDNPLKLRYDMARQFDMSKAVDFSKNENGEEKFSIFMELGDEKKRTFRTVWQKDTEDSVLRIITAHREDKKHD